MNPGMSLEEVTQGTGEGDGTPLQCSCLDTPMDGEAGWAAVHGVEKSRTRLSDFTSTLHFHALEKAMAAHSVFLPGESQGRGSLVGCRLWGHTESDTAEATWQQQQQLTSIQLFATRWAVAHQAPLSMGSFRQEC